MRMIEGAIPLAGSLLVFSPAFFSRVEETPVRSCRKPGHIIQRNDMEKQTYESPEIEVLEVCVERGFAVSEVDGEIEGFDREEWS